MRSRQRLPSVLALVLVLAAASTARADDSAATSAVPPATIPTHVLVHIESPKPLQLESRAPGETRWTTACGVPCDEELPLADEYRIAYEDTAAPRGEPFRLTADAGRKLLLKVVPASAAGKVGGGVLIGVGVALCIASVVGAVVAVLVQPTGPCHTDDCGGGPALGRTLLVISGAEVLAAAGAIVGGARLRASSKASTEQRPWAGREPTWSVSRAATTPGTGLVVPLSFSF